MSSEDVEATLIKLQRQVPFQPYIIDLADGRSLRVDGHRLAINGGGAGMLTADDTLEDFWFADVRNIRQVAWESVS